MDRMFLERGWGGVRSREPNGRDRAGRRMWVVEGVLETKTPRSISERSVQEVQPNAKTITYQWQKSLDTTKMVSSLARYGASSLPYVTSLS